MLAALAACTTTALPPVPEPAPTEAGRWAQDVRWMARAVRRWHPDPYASDGREAFHDEVEGLAGRMDQLEVPDRVLGILRALAHIGDSHTRLIDTEAIEDLRLPYSVEVQGGQFWIAAVQASRRDLDITQVVGVEGRGMQEVVRRLGVLVPFENQVSLNSGVAALLSLPRALREVGITRDLERVRLRLRDRHGVEFDAEVESLRRDEIGSWFSYVPRPQPAQGYRQDELWWWEPLPEQGTLYLQYNQCRDRETAPRFADLAAELLARLDAGGFERVVVDLRYNAGGDSSVLRPLRDGLAARNAEVVCLIGPWTYSSGVLNAWQLATEAGASLVGEPTGGKPNHFGEMRRMELPFSGLGLYCSTKTFRLVRGDPPSLEPDLVVPTTFEDVLAGRDPVMAAVLGAR